MAGISEMIQLAKYIGQGEAESNPMFAVAQGANAFQKGFSSGQTTPEQQVERALKIMELRDKIVEQKKKESDLEISRNIAKGAGLLDLEDKEVNVIRQASFGNMNAEDNLAPGSKTQKGKIQGLIDTAEYSRFEVVPQGNTKDGFRMGIQEKKEGAKGTAGGSASDRAERNSIWTMARQMALIEEREKLSDKDFMAKYATEWSSPPEDVIRKYVPEATEWLKEGDPNKLFVDWRAKKKAKFEKENPLGDPAKRKYQAKK